MPHPPSSLSLFAVCLAAVACTDAGSDGSPDDASVVDARIGPETDADIREPEAGAGDAAPASVDAGPPVLDAELRVDLGRLDPPDAFVSPLPEVCLAPPSPSGPQPIDLDPPCRAAGEPLRIRDLRNPACPDAPGFADRNQDGFSDARVDVVLSEAVVSAVFYDAFAVQDPEGLAWGGVWVYMGRDPVPAGVRPGARVQLTGQFFEFYTVAEITPEPGGVVVLGQGEPPAPVTIGDPSRLRGGDLAEPLENMWLEIGDVAVISTEPDCPRDFDMFLVDGGLRIEDELGLDWEPARADFIRRLAGVLHFSFDTWKLRPRSDADIEWVHCGGVPDKCEAAACAVEVGTPETRALVITEIMDDPVGLDVEREWLELYNPNPEEIALDGWRIEQCSGQAVALTGRIRGGQRLVVAARLDPEINGGVQAEALLGDVVLGNEAGTVLVFDEQDRLVDQVRYIGAAPWPWREVGESLELVAPAADNANGAAWRAGRDMYGPGGRGTPGR